MFMLVWMQSLVLGMFGAIHGKLDIGVVGVDVFFFNELFSLLI